MFMNAVEIMLNKKKGRMDKDDNKKLGKRGWYFLAPVPATYYIDVVW
jgi:hypothetical protein